MDPILLEEDFNRKGDHLYNEIEKIWPMLIYLGEFESKLTNRKLHYFTCTNLKENGDCAIYDNRPTMCSDYPYGDKCEQSECTWDYAKNLPERTDLLKIIK